MPPTKVRGMQARKRKQKKIILTAATGKSGNNALLNPNIPKPEFRLTGQEKIQLVKKGISKKELESLKHQIGLDYDRLARIFSVTRTKLINKKTDAKFDSAISEKILALAEIYSYGYEVFEEKEKLNLWIKTPNRAFGNETPIDLLDTIYGMQEVKHLIGRIDYGIYS